MNRESPVASFEIHLRRYMDHEGGLICDLPKFANAEKLIDLYSAMVRTRTFDAKAITLQRTGKLGTYPSVLGQEAIGVGIGRAMSKEDVLCPYYREIAAQFLRGVTMVEILLYWGGDERGSNFAHQPYDFPICVPIASQTLHAVGIAKALKHKKEPRVVVAVVGDGGTSRGDFYEALNLAGVWNLPIVFIINNNQWAISVPREEQTAARTLAQKGIAAGINVEQVDGNDVIAMLHAVSDAIDVARNQYKPTLIEAITYRLSDHTTADDARRYREQVELEKYQLEDPILRLNRYLRQNNLWDDNRENALKLSVGEEVTKAVQDYLNIEPKKPETMFDHLYEKLPSIYEPEREELKSLKVIKHE